MAAHGSLALPARLDPFQEIVEVGWKSYVAFRLEFFAKRSASGRVYAGEAFVYEDNTTYLNSWIDWVGYWRTAGTPQYYKRVSGAWVSQGLASDLTGVPSLPTTEPASSAAAGAYVVTAETISGDYTARWTGGGAATQIEVPSHPGEFFETALSATLAIRAAPFTEAMKWTAWPPPPEAGAFLSYSAPVGAVENVHPQALDFSNTVLIHDGKAFRAMAMKAVDISNPFDPGILWVLCERSPVDDPTA